MKQPLLIGIAAILFVGILALGAFALLDHNQPASTGTSTGSFPVTGNSPSTTGTGSGTASTKTISVENTQGGTITTKDFIHNGSTVLDANNKDDYYLIGSPTYCPGGLCPSTTPTPSYYITYRQSSQAFIIGLSEEPLGQSRLDAEQYLMSTLGITQTQMCNLNYYVLTTSDVNDQYAGKNLGFSFCPGAVDLPSS